MSAILESALDPERRAAAQANDVLHAFGSGPSGAGYGPHGGYVWPQVLPRTEVALRCRREFKAGRAALAEWEKQ